MVASLPVLNGLGIGNEADLCTCTGSADCVGVYIYTELPDWVKGVSVF